MKNPRARRLDPARLHTYSLLSRRSLVEVNDFAKLPNPGRGVGGLVDSLPNILAGRDFREFLALLKRARGRKRPVIFGLGAHVIKVGLSPVIIRLLEEGWISALALNGAGIIHDFEIAYCGRTSEEVASQVKSGAFGMAEETGRLLNRAIRAGARQRIGLGEAVGGMIARSTFPYKKLSLLEAAFRLGLPATVHVAVGTDTIHFHPGSSGAALGRTSLADFFLFCSLVAGLDGGGVFVNVGSAVILPEVFLKAVSYVRNLGRRLDDFSTAVFDFRHQYRPDQNVARRVLGKKGRGFYFIGHHEIMIPLLAAALAAQD